MADARSLGVGRLAKWKVVEAEGTVGGYSCVLG